MSDDRGKPRNRSLSSRLETQGIDLFHLVSRYCCNSFVKKSCSPASVMIHWIRLAVIAMTLPLLNKSPLSSIILWIISRRKPSRWAFICIII